MSRDLEPFEFFCRIPILKQVSQRFSRNLFCRSNQGSERLKEFLGKEAVGGQIRQLIAAEVQPANGNYSGSSGNCYGYLLIGFEGPPHRLFRFYCTRGFIHMRYFEIHRNQSLLTILKQLVIR